MFKRALSSKAMPLDETGNNTYILWEPHKNIGWKKHWKAPATLKFVRLQV